MRGADLGLPAAVRRVRGAQEDAVQRGQSGPRAEAAETVEPADAE